MENVSSKFADLICFSHLRWNFVFQRPQHLLSRFAKYYRVFYVEEAIFNDGPDKLGVKKADKNIWIITLQINQSGTEKEKTERQKKFLSNFFELVAIKNYISWYYTPIAIEISNHLHPELIIYDCMDELSAFKFAPASLKKWEQELINCADIVFTGGNSLYKAKKHLHKNIHSFPSSIDKEHFSQARMACEEPLDQATIPHPRIGFFGVIDERMDIDLLMKVANDKPDWHFVIIGPIIKINPEHLPQYQNIHYLGGKSYQELPKYIAGWDIAMIPFAKNKATEFISPTKTPEYLAAGKPVISTAIHDVVDPYGNNCLVHIVNNAEEFIKSVEYELAITNRKEWLERIDAFLAKISWDKTWRSMVSIIMNELTYKHIQIQTNAQLTIINKKEGIYV